MAKTKKKKLTTEERTIMKLSVDYLIPGRINQELQYIEFLKAMSERMRADLGRKEK